MQLFRLMGVVALVFLLVPLEARPNPGKGNNGNGNEASDDKGNKGNGKGNGKSDDGAPCDDGLFCTVDDRWVGGRCVGSPRTCDDGVDFCHSASCDEGAGACVVFEREPGCVDQCASKKDAHQYQSGWRQAHHALSKRWGKGGDCDDLEPFLDAVYETLEDATLPGGGASQHQHRLCRLAGRLDGAFQALEDIQVACDGACMLSGEVTGAMAATTYCELVLASDGAIAADLWLRQPVGLCGFAYQTSCDGTFIGATKSYASDRGVCGPFTQGAFFQLWHRSRLRMCDYGEQPAP